MIADVRALLDELPSRSAVYFVEQIVRLRCATSLAARRRVAPPQTECDACGSGAEPPLLLPCGHACSEACGWAAACGPKHRGELRCPKCAELLGGLLHLGDVSFVKLRTSEGGVSEEGCNIAPEAAAALANAEGLLGVAGLARTLTVRIVRAGGGRSSVYKVPLDVAKAEATRDALAKRIYER